MLSSKAGQSLSTPLLWRGMARAAVTALGLLGQQSTPKRKVTRANPTGNEGG